MTGIVGENIVNWSVVLILWLNILCSFLSLWPGLNWCFFLCRFKVILCLFFLLLFSFSFRWGLLNLKLQLKELEDWLCLQRVLAIQCLKTHLYVFSSRVIMSLVYHQSMLSCIDLVMKNSSCSVSCFVMNSSSFY